MRVLVQLACVLVLVTNAPGRQIRGGPGATELGESAVVAATAALPVKRVSGARRGAAELERERKVARWRNGPAGRRAETMPAANGTAVYKDSHT